MADNKITTILTVIDNANPKLNKTIKTFERFEETTKIIKKVTESAGNMSTTITKKFNQLTPVMKKLRARTKALEDVAINTGQSMNFMRERVKGLRTGTVAFRRELKKITDESMPRFNMSLLSIMFGGMMLQRVFGRITKSVTSTFTKVMESSDIAGTAVQRLGAHWEFLKFVVGSTINRVLEPLMPLITRIINKIADFIQQHPEATVATIIGLLTAGTFLAAIGSIGLFLGGLAQWAPSKALLNFFSGGIRGIAPAVIPWSFSTTAIAPAIGALIAAIAATALFVWLLWKFDVGNIQERFKEIKKHIANKEFAKIPIEILFWHDQVKVELNEFGARVINFIFELGQDITDTIFKAIKLAFTDGFKAAADFVKGTKLGTLFKFGDIIAGGATKFGLDALVGSVDEFRKYSDNAGIFRKEIDLTKEGVTKMVFETDKAGESANNLFTPDLTTKMKNYRNHVWSVAETQGTLFTSLDDTKNKLVEVKKEVNLLREAFIELDGSMVPLGAD